jgi:hypothetical protein
MAITLYEKMDEDELVRSFCKYHVKLAEDTENTVRKLRTAANYLDEVWEDCQVARVVGTGVSVAGGVATVGAGILTVCTGGLATPLLVAGLIGTTAGAVTNITARVIETIHNSNKIKDMEAALRTQRSHVDTGKEILSLLAKKDGAKILMAAYEIQRLGLSGSKCVGRFLDYCRSGLATPGAGHMVRHFGQAMQNCSGAGAGAAAECASAAARGVRKSGAVIAGVGAVFLVWDAIDLGICINDLVKKKGSKVGNTLRDKARELESWIQAICCGNCR